MYKPIANIICNGEKLKVFLLRLKTLLFNLVWKSSQVCALALVREIEGIQNGKKEVKLSLLADDMILYIENAKDPTKKLLEINKFSRVVWHKINIKYMFHFYTLIMNNQEEKLRKQSHLQLH